MRSAIGATLLRIKNKVKMILGVKNALIKGLVFESVVMIQEKLHPYQSKLMKPSEIKIRKNNSTELCKDYSIPFINVINAYYAKYYILKEVIFLK